MVDEARDNNVRARDGEVGDNRGLRSRVWVGMRVTIEDNDMK